MDWQVESGLRKSVFVSATTSDLGECRRRVSEVLLKAGIFPVVQEHFGPDPRTIEGLLTDKILMADAVICLVGHAFGCAPADAESGTIRSYTQTEYDLAVRYGKQIYLFVAKDEFAEDRPIGDSEAFRANQEAHRKAILAGTAGRYQEFSSVGELESLEDVVRGSGLRDGPQGGSRGRSRDCLWSPSGSC